MSSLTTEQIAELVASSVAAAMAAQESPEPDAVTQKVLNSAPKPATQSRARETVSKASGITRKLTVQKVPAGDVTFHVSATTPGGSLLTKGARVFPYVGEAKYPEKSLTLPVLEALAGKGVIAKLAGAVDDVSKLALIGAHSPNTSDDDE